MPHRIIRTVAGVHGGALVIVGLWYIAQGLAWVLSPSVGLSAGVAWVPHGWVTQDSVGWLWAGSGALALAAGLASKGRRWLETLGYVVALFVPVLVVVWFLVAAYLDRPVTGPIGIIMIAGPTGFVAWVGLRAQDEPVAAKEIP